MGGSVWWIVKVEWSTPTPEKDSKSKGTQNEKPESILNPLLEIPEVETSTEKHQEVIFYIYDTTTNTIQPCKASNGQVFDPPPVKDASRLSLKITRNEILSDIHPNIDVQYTDTVNSDIFWGCPPGTWKIQMITTKRENKQLPGGTIFPYLKCSYKLEARTYQVKPGDNWDLLLLDSGSFFYYQKTQASPKVKIPFIDDAGHPRIGPLDGKGGNLNNEQRGLYPGTNDGGPPVFLPFRIYRRKSFGFLQLPQGFTQIA